MTFGEFSRVFSDHFGPERVITPPDRLNVNINNRHVEFPGQLFIAPVAWGILVQKSDPQTVLKVERPLVDTQDIPDRIMPVFGHKPHQFLYRQNIHIVHRPGFLLVRLHVWIAECGIDDLKGMLKLFPQDFPPLMIAVMPADHHHASALLVQAVRQLRIQSDEPSLQIRDTHGISFNGLGDHVEEILVKPPVQRHDLIIRLIGKGIPDVIVNHLTPITNQVKNNIIKKPRYDLHDAERQDPEELNKHPAQDINKPVNYFFCVHRCFSVFGLSLFS